jgi:diguanylate cyclase (GGDEF)-like protein/PAS domain S-box-containing protein
MSEPVRILQVEDVATDAQLAMREFKRAGLNCESRCVETEPDFRRELVDFKPDVVLSDFSMPRFSGMQALSIAAGEFPDIPFIFVSGTLGEEYAVRALKNGATDYVLKTNLIRLPAAVERAIDEARKRRARERVDRDLRESEERFRQMAANIREVFWMHSTDSHANLYVSPSFEKVWQRPIEDIGDVHRQWAASIVEEDRQRVLESFAGMVAGEGMFDAEYRIAQPDGSVRWIHDRGFPVRDAQGRLYRAAGIAEDITARKQAEQRLRESEAGLSRAQSMAKLAHIITGLDGVFETWSDGLPDLLGVQAQQVQQVPKSTRAWLAYIHPDDREHFRRMSLEAAVSGARVDVEYRLRREGGDWIHIRQVIEPVEKLPDASSVEHWFCTLHDVTAQKQSEQGIRRLNRLYAVLSGINAAILRLRNRQELFEESCRIIVEEGGFSVGWMAVIDPATGLLLPVAQAGLPDEYGPGRVLADGQHGLAPMGTSKRALQQKRPAVDNDILNSSDVAGTDAPPNALNVRRAAIRNGAKSVIALPLFVEGQTFGILTLYAPERNFFDDDEVKLLSELADDISFAVEFIEKGERLDFLAYYDALTGLPNSTLFRDRLTQFVHAASAGKGRVAAISINLDRFRHLNDTLGRQAGDALLKIVGERIRNALPEPFSVARIGADNFAIAVAGIEQGEDVASLLLEKVFADLSQPCILGRDEIRVSVKAGIALYPDDGADAETLFRNSEAALKQAKSSGESLLFYAPEMNAHIAEKLTLENKLRLAVERQEFVLHYQPKVGMQDGRICGLEALIRWNNPETGLVPPLKFIPLLEETGLIIPVGAWALGQAAADYRALTDKGLVCPRIAVNVSPLQLKQKDFAQSIAVAVGASSSGAHGLDLEITESVIMENVENSIAQLRAARAIGINIAIDDFGTGYSSLAYIARLPVDTLKIDRSFIMAMEGSAEDRNIVSTIISLAHALGLKVVAEGVETQSQQDLLRGLQCDQMQGYLFSAPVPIERIEAMLRNQKA